MKNINWQKVAKAAGVIAIIALAFWYFQSRSHRASNEKDKLLSGIASLADELHDLSIYAEDSLDYDYEDRGISLYHLQEKCEELSQQAEELLDSKYLAEPEVEENRRSWFY